MRLGSGKVTEAMGAFLSTGLGGRLARLEHSKQTRGVSSREVVRRDGVMLTLSFVFMLK
jgi:hypothetical protein